MSRSVSQIHYMKACSKCKIVKELKEFHKNKGNKNGIHSQCKECTRKYTKQYNQLHKKEILIYDKNYYQLHKQEVGLKHGQWDQTLEGKVSKKNRNARRRIACKKTDITSKWLLDLIVNTKVCPNCGILLTNEPYLPNSKHLEHKVPLNVKGTHTKDNVRIWCRTCNLSRPKNGSDYLSL